MKPLEPTEIVRWFRQQAAEFTAIADNLEKTFKPDGTPLPVAAKNSAKSRSPVGLEELRQFILIHRAVRLREIADHFDCDIEEVRSLVATHPEALRVSRRGLIKVRPNSRPEAPATPPGGHGVREFTAALKVSRARLRKSPEEAKADAAI